MRRRQTASGNFVRKLPGWIRCATLLPDFLHVIAGRQNLSACFVGDGNIGNQAGIEGLFPDRRLGRQVRANLPVAVEKRVRHEPLSQIKTPPAIAITDGAFELIFPVDFSFLSYLLAPSTLEVQPRSWFFRFRMEKFAVADRYRSSALDLIWSLAGRRQRGDYNARAALPLNRIGPLGRPMGEPPSGSSVISK